MDPPKHAYFQGKIVPYSEAKVGVLTHGFNYGTAVFAGIRGYWNQDEGQMYVFRPRDHFQRFLNSAKLMCMDFDHTPESLTQITLDLLREEEYQTDIYIRPLGYKADEVVGVKLHDLDNELTIAAVPFTSYLANETNAHVTISSWRRLDDNAIPARGKISGAYVNSAFIKTDAVRAGFDEALVLTQDGHISEGSAMNVFMLRDGILVTPPTTDNILEGITRHTAIELVARELDIPVEVRKIDRTEVYLADELFMTGTAAQIIAVTRVDFREVGSGMMGPVTARLRKLFDDVVRGRVAKYHHWTTPVYIREPVQEQV